MTDQPLADQTALVTGASRGIGAATAKALAAKGAHVVLVARTATELEAVEDAIFANGGTATIAPLDLSETDGITRLGGAIAERWGALDMLVLNAGALGTLGAVNAYDLAELNGVFALNVTAQAAMIGTFDAMLRNAAQARVVAVTSSVARNPRAYWGMYGASKAALENLVLAYGEEVRHVSGVRVGIVDPGATRTRMRARAFPGENPATLKAPDVVGDRIAALMAEGFETGHFERVE